MFFKLISTTILIISTTAKANDYDCYTTYQWAKKTFEENDAGSEYIIQKKGHSAYKIHNELFDQRIKPIKDRKECQVVVTEWLHFFRKAHLGFYAKSQEKSDKDAIKTYPSIEVNTTEFIQYLKNKKAEDLEGVWKFASYEIGIKKMDQKYVGFIIKSTNPSWQPGQIKVEIDLDLKNATYYQGDHSELLLKDLKLESTNLLMLGDIAAARIAPMKTNNTQSMQIYIDHLTSANPSVTMLNQKTLLLSIPSFNPSETKKIEDLIIKNFQLITKTENLIIDLRGNGGGNDFSFQPIIPLIYTHPIRTVPMQIKVTPLNVQQYLRYSEDPNLTEANRKELIDLHAKLSKHIGKFYPESNKDIDIIKKDKIYQYPKQVAILINNTNASTTEQFLLAAKQSKKVKLIGKTTIGALDISNIPTIESPDKQFILSYGLTKSFRIPHMAIDDIGLQPDIYLDETIPESEWVTHVMKNYF